MKTIQVKGGSVNWATHGWALPSIYMVLAIIDFLGNQTTNYILFPSALVWLSIVVMNRTYTRKGLFISKYSLEFGECDLICRHGNSMIWHVSYSRISHVEVETTNTSSWFNPKNKLTLIHTKDGDSYSIPIQICDEQNKEISAVISNVIV